MGRGSVTTYKMNITLKTFQNRIQNEILKEQLQKRSIEELLKEMRKTSQIMAEFVRDGMKEVANRDFGSRFGKINIHYTTAIRKYGIYIRFFTDNVDFGRFIMEIEQNAVVIIQPKSRRGMPFMDTGRPKAYLVPFSKNPQGAVPRALAFITKSGEKIFTMWVGQTVTAQKMRAIQMLMDARRVALEHMERSWL